MRNYNCQESSLYYFWFQLSFAITFYSKLYIFWSTVVVEGQQIGFPMAQVAAKDRAVKDAKPANRQALTKIPFLGPNVFKN